MPSPIYSIKSEAGRAIFFGPSCIVLASLTGAQEGYLESQGKRTWIRPHRIIAAMASLVIVALFAAVTTVWVSLGWAVLWLLDQEDMLHYSRPAIALQGASSAVLTYYSVAALIFLPATLVLKSDGGDRRTSTSEPPEPPTASATTRALPVQFAPAKSTPNRRTLIYADVGIVSAIAGVVAIAGSDGAILALTSIGIGIVALFALKRISR